MCMRSKTRFIFQNHENKVSSISLSHVCFFLLYGYAAINFEIFVEECYYFLTTHYTIDSEQWRSHLEV